MYVICHPDLRSAICQNSGSGQPSFGTVPFFQRCRDTLDIGRLSWTENHTRAMNDLAPDSEGGAFGIAAVERDTGLSKDTLRVWERRYRFPLPLRDTSGERV